jgi:hypothetical protein
MDPLCLLRGGRPAQEDDNLQRHHGVRREPAGGCRRNAQESGSDDTRAILIGRQGGDVPTRIWGTRRSSTWYATAAAAGSDVLDQMVTIFNGSQAQLYRRNGPPVTATSTVAFNIGRLGLGFAGASTYVSCPRAYISEGWFGRDDIDTIDRASCTPISQLRSRRRGRCCSLSGVEPAVLKGFRP